MSTVHIFVGQCGNQVGSAFLDTLAEEAASSSSEAYQMMVSSAHFRPPFRSARNSRSSAVVSRSSGCRDSDDAIPQPRCVMVDMEPKVIQEAIYRANKNTHTRQTAKTSSDGAARRDSVDTREEEEDSSAALPEPASSAPLYSLSPQQCVTRGEGSGNNWAYGYHVQGESRREAIAECLRREREAENSTISTYHVVHSIAGGTGSGVGCLAAEVVKEEYPHAVLNHSIVWPFACGEVVTQWFNVVLAMSTLRDVIDSGVILYNDDVSGELKGVTATTAAAAAASSSASPSLLGVQEPGVVSYTAMNRSLSRLLAPLYLPQQLFTVPPPRRDTGKNRIPGTQVAHDEEQLRHNMSRRQRHSCAEDLVESLALDPSMKFFTPRRVPALAGTTTTTWQSVLGDAARACRQSFTSSTALAGSTDAWSAAHAGKQCLWAIRGCHAVRDGMRELQDVMAAHSAGGMPFPLTSLWLSPDEAPCASGTRGLFGRPDHEVTMYGHAPIIATRLETALKRVEELLRVGAYSHHFERYGVGKHEVGDALVRLWDTARAYAEV